MRQVRVLLYACTFAGLLAVGLVAQNTQGGAFVTSEDYAVSGDWTFTGTVTQTGTTQALEVASTDAESPLRLIGGDRSLLLSDTAAGGALYGEDVDETLSLGALDPIDGSGLVQRFLYGFFRNLYTGVLYLTNADGNDFTEGMRLDDDDGYVYVGGGRRVITEGATQAPSLQLTPTVFNDLGAPDDGTLMYCSDCTIADPCDDGGDGAFAKRLDGGWVCD